MSLIQEALKRQQMENGEAPVVDSAPTPTAAPRAEPAPPKSPPPPLPQKKNPAGSRKKEATGGGGKAGKVFLLLLLLGGIGWVGSRHLRPALEELFPDRFKPTIKDQPSPSPVSPMPSSPPSTPPGDLSPTETEPGNKTSVRPAEPGSTVEPAPVELVAEDGAGKAIWPLLELNGIVGIGANGSCFINGRIVTVGETVQDVKIVAIRKNGVELEYEGERRFLRVGGAMP